MPEENVGSVGEEALKLLRELSAPTVSDQVPGSEEPAGPRHECTTGWCPVCRVVGFVKQNPEAVEQLTDAALVFARSVRDVLDRAVDRQEPRP